MSVEAAGSTISSAKLPRSGMPSLTPIRLRNTFVAGGMTPPSDLIVEVAVRTFSMRVPEALDRDLGTLARQRGVSKSALVREALAELVSRKREPGSAPGSFLAAAEDLAGCVEGPKDLSCNKDHLAGYGR